MLPAARRLTASRDFAATTRRGRRTSTPLLVLHLLRSPERTDGVSGRVVPVGRVGFVVSKAVGNAVVRNRVERRLRHAARGHLDLVPAGASLVVRALPAAARASYADLERDLVTGLGRSTSADARVRASA